MVNWSPALRSVLSDIEVEHHEVEGELVSIRYGDGDDAVVVATTRVETMLGDTAVAVHPDDERYAHLVGREIELPLVGRMIPVVADEHVDPSFGTGAVKVTPAHDPNDFEIGRRHGLPMPTIMDESGRIAGTGTEFDGMDRFEARVAVREALARAGPDRRREAALPAQRRALRSGPRSRSSRGCRCSGSSRSGRWPQAAGDAVRDGRVAVHPKEMEPRCFAWVDNMHDWCISRQLWWGHRIPVWYGPDGEVVCLGPDDEPPGRLDPGRGRARHLVLLGAVAVLHAGLAGEDARPGALLPDVGAGHRLRHPVLLGRPDDDVRAVRRRRPGPAEAVPFHTIALHGMVRDEHGKKMSKSAGNTVDPLEWMDAYGTDALRFTLARAANPGTDAPIGEDNVAGARNFGTKLWNATRFALANGASPGAAAAGRADRRRRLDPGPAARGPRADRRAAGGLPVRQGRRGALPLHLGRALRLVPGAGQAPAAPTTGDRRRHPGGARARARRAAAAAAPGDPVPHRGAVAGAHRAASRWSIAPWPTEVGRGRRRRGRGPGRRRCRSWSPRSAGSAPSSGCPTAAGSRPGWSGWTRPASGRAPAGRARVPGPAGRAGRRLRADGHPGGRACVGAAPCSSSWTPPGAIDVAAERARLGRDLAAAQKELEQADAEAGQPEVRREGAGRGGRGHPGAAGRRGGRDRADRRPAGARCDRRTDDPMTGPEGDGEIPTPEDALISHVLDAIRGSRLAGRGAGDVHGRRVRRVPRRRGRAGPALAGDGDGAVAASASRRWSSCSASRTAATRSCT